MWYVELCLAIIIYVIVSAESKKDPKFESL